MSALLQILVVHMATMVLESLLFSRLRLRYHVPPDLEAQRGAHIPHAPGSCHPLHNGNPPYVYCVRFFHAFLGPNSRPTGASEYYLEDWRRPQVTQSALTLVAILIGDAAIIHRLWLIWNRDIRLVIVPCVSWLAVFACRTAVPCLLSDPSENRIFLLSTLHWVQANWILSLVLVYPFTSQPYHLTPFQD
ncbi:hypothetical protein B0H16DRAFT_1850431 [Mycena metata]|uniref:Uncharacterized protein n=1 Tax=Mycena metata TaxID=1033252 RepID=A0AAD7IPP8_9AGAR|nr:hypothetical protein B0H16DRAFT_1850431 [Mycena metata]